MISKMMGIYAISNKITGEQYIGSSKNVNKRWKAHQIMLSQGKHHCYKLQSAWDEYGKDAFSFCVWEYVKRQSDLYKIEQRYLEMFCPAYNARLNAGSCGVKKTKVKYGSGRRIVSSRFAS